MVGGGATLLSEILVTRPPLEQIANFEPIFARSASAVTHCEKKFN